MVPDACNAACRPRDEPITARQDHTGLAHRGRSSLALWGDCPAERQIG
jgi:hypothetical protein